jgi:hypothetical protein
MVQCPSSCLPARRPVEAEITHPLKFPALSISDVQRMLSSDGSWTLLKGLDFLEGSSGNHYTHHQGLWVLGLLISALLSEAPS